MQELWMSFAGWYVVQVQWPGAGELAAPMNKHMPCIGHIAMMRYATSMHVRYAS
jgi:hypothetical protein